MKMHLVKVICFIFLGPSIALAATSKKIDAFPEGERMIYIRIVELFRKGQIEELVRQKRLLERKYPASIHLDNVYYMLGRLEFDSGRYGEALRAFSFVDRRFEKSNKRPAALFAMGSTYQKLGLTNQASRVWNRLLKTYPGSVESDRAHFQLRIGQTAIGQKGKGRL